MASRSVVWAGRVAAAMVVVLAPSVVWAEGAANAPAPQSPASAQPKRDPKGHKGISPFWEAVRKGDAALLAKDVEAALAAYKEAVQAEPDNAMGHYRLGQAHASRQSWDEADSSYATAIRFAQTPQMKARIMLVRADLQERKRAIEEARQGWAAYKNFILEQPRAKGYGDTADDRSKRLEAWAELEQKYGEVKARIAKRLEEANEKAKQSAADPKNK